MTRIVHTRDDSQDPGNVPVREPHWPPTAEETAVAQARQEAIRPRVLKHCDQYVKGLITAEELAAHVEGAIYMHDWGGTDPIV